MSALSLLMADLAKDSTSSDWVIVLPGHPDFDSLLAKHPGALRPMDDVEQMAWRLGWQQFTFSDLAHLPKVTATYSDGTTNHGAAAHWAELLTARPELKGPVPVSASYCDAHGHGPRSIWTVTVRVTQAIAELMDRPTSTWQWARSAPRVGTYNDRYGWCKAVLEDPEACREQADAADDEVDAHHREQNLWQEAHAACPLPYASPQEVPPRRSIGSMGFKAWKGAYDAAVLANQQYADWQRWVNNYAAKRS